MKHLVLFSFMFLSIPGLFAGVDSSGGGPSVVKFDSNGGVAHAMLLDVYEGRVRYNFDIPETNQPVEEVVAKAVQRMKSRHLLIGLELERTIQEIEQAWTFLPEGVVMAPGVDLGDSHAAIMPTGYQLLYAGFYESNGMLKISQDIYKKMNNIDKAALIIHEALYKMARIYHWINRSERLRDSSQSRYLTALLLSNQSMEVVNNKVLNDLLTWRRAPSTSKLLSPLVLENSHLTFIFRFSPSKDPNGIVRVSCLVNDTQGEQILSFSDNVEQVIAVAAKSPATGRPCRALLVQGYADVKVEMSYNSNPFFTGDLGYGFTLPIY